MMHSPIQLRDISLSFSHKICFERLTTQIHYGNRIAIIGRNGCGKSSLLKILQGSLESTSGDIKIPDNARIGYVPQVVASFKCLSGGQRFNKVLTQALSVDPNILLLDEPTNHLDTANRNALMRMLGSFQGTLIVISHDVVLLRHCVDILWYIDNGKVQLFAGNYDEFMQECDSKRASIKEEISSLNRQKKELHKTLMKEQKRAAKSRAKGEKSIEKRKWPTIVSKAKASRASETSGRKKCELADKKRELSEKLSDLRLPEMINPKFYLSAAKVHSRAIVSVNEGSIGYSNEMLLSNINLSMASHDRIAIMGENGSGKSTLIRAILNDKRVIKSGVWQMPPAHDMGNLDQHYDTLAYEKTVLETIEELVPWPHTKIRYHLNDFLFRKNEEVNALVSTLSGGEKARLSLAKIAVKTPRLLILDEITNNLDLTTREYVIHVLQEYPGAMIVISHDEDFLQSIKIQDFYLIENRSLHINV